MAEHTTDPPDDSASATVAVETKVSRPKLRRVERFERELDGERVLILSDPMGVSESFALDAEFAPALDLLDGSRTVTQIRQSLRMRGVLDLPADDLTAFVDSLSAAGWLDDESFRARWEDLHADFLDEDPRAARFAGILYPADPQAVGSAYAQILGPSPRTSPGSDAVGVLVPHGPLDLVGDVLAATLVDLPPADMLDCIVVLGTDHGPGLLPYAATRRGFSTPLGIVPAHEPLLDALDRRVEWAYREELRHRGAHSIELSALTLRALYGEAVPPIVPILCGVGVLRTRDSEAGERFLDALETLLEGQRALIWGSAELSHGGVAYGRPALDDAGVEELQDRDRGVLEDLVRGRTQALARKCSEEHPQGRPSGGAVMSSMRALLPDARAHVQLYRSAAPIDAPMDASPSVAGLAGVQFFRPR